MLVCRVTKCLTLAPLETLGARWAHKALVMTMPCPRGPGGVATSCMHTMVRLVLLPARTQAGGDVISCAPPGYPAKE